MDNDPSAVLIRSLQDASLYDHPVTGFDVRETHISWVLLTGGYAYKIKKPVNLGFLDFSTLDLRHRFCREEVRLNSRYAADLYLGVVGIYGEPAAPSFQPAGEPIEFAVKMRQFDTRALLSRLAETGRLGEGHIDAMAEEVAGFHLAADAAPEGEPYGDPDEVREWALENFTGIRALHDEGSGEDLDRLQDWTRGEFDRLREYLFTRRREGFIRECHGDLHLGNMFAEDARVRMFDCIEFNPALRWIDVMSETAFVFMDLLDRSQQSYAWRFLNHYLQHTGDYGGLGLLSWYVVYRALVRAKVTLMRLEQGRLSGRQEQAVRGEARAYIELARGQFERSPPCLVMTRGLSGSGKSWLAERLAGRLPAVHLRSDVERKRLHGLEQYDRSGSGPGTGIYTVSATRETYTRLADLAESTLRAGYSTIVDATFLRQEQREVFLRLARGLGMGLVILDLQAPESLLRQRIRRRQRSRRDASEADTAILDRQLATAQPLTGPEASHAVTVDSAAETDWSSLLAAIRHRAGH